MIELYEKNALLNHVNYTFQHPPSKRDYNDRTLEYFRALYKFIKENLSTEYRDIEQVLFAKYVHGSNAIEGNSLSESEVHNYLYKDESPHRKSHNELLQTRNHFRVEEFLQNHRGEINIRLIKNIHELMMSGVDGYDGNDKAGEFRHNIAKAGHLTGSKPDDIEKDVSNSIEEYRLMLNQNIHPIECMAVFHSKYERIHPFREGNGRTGRAILDYMLKINGFPSIYFRAVDRVSYLNALHECNYENYTPLVNLLIDRIVSTFAYTAARSTMYHVLVSDRYRSFFVGNISSDEHYNQLVSLLNDIRTSGEDP